MKRYFTILVALLATTTIAFAKANKQTVVFDVDLHCQGCVNKVQNNIAYEKGMIDLLCDLEKKQVTVVYDANKTSVDKLQAAFAAIKKPAKVNAEATQAAQASSSAQPAQKK